MLKTEKGCFQETKNVFEEEHQGCSVHRRSPRILFRCGSDADLQGQAVMALCLCQTSSDTHVSYSRTELLQQETH